MAADATAVTPMTTALGVVMLILGTTCSAVGAQLMKWSHETETHLPLWKRWRLLLGLFFALILLLAFDSVSYAVLPLALIAPFGGLPIIISAVLSSTGAMGVHEPLDCADCFATLAVLGGVTIVSVVTTSTSYHELDLESLAHASLEHPVFLSLLGIGACCDAVWLALHFVRPLRTRTIDVWESGGAVWPTVVSSALGALNAGFQQLFMKTVSEAAHELASDVPPARVLSHWNAVVSFVGLLTLGPMSAVLINLSLGPGRRINLAVPVYQSLTLLLTIAFGAYFLHEVQVRNGRSTFLFVLGVALVIAGLCTLSCRLRNRQTGSPVAPSSKKGPLL